MHRTVICGALLTALTLPASAAGELVDSWRTDGGWLTELRVHPNGAKVCSTGKASNTPHQFGLTFVRSGPENVVLLVDQQEPPSGSGNDMTFTQAGQTVATLKVETAGPAWASADPKDPAAAELMSKLKPGAVTISIANRQYEADLAGYGDAMAQLTRCEEQARS